MWWSALAATLLIKLIFEDIVGPTSSSTPTTSTSSYKIPEHGQLKDSKIVVVGRTGVGKSTFMNALGANLKVTDIASTTREIEGVSLYLEGKRITFVDTPGIGEVDTHYLYYNALLNWINKNILTIKCIVLTLQADNKAYSDEEKFLREIKNRFNNLNIIILLTQVDKIKPIRNIFRSENWKEEKRIHTIKSQNIEEKIDIVAKQFAVLPEQILPISITEEQIFNLDYVKKSILRCLERQY